MNRLDAPDSEIPAETPQDFIVLGRRLAARMAVAIMVFEGGLALDIRELKASGEGVLRLTAIALPINFALGTSAAHMIGGMMWGPASVFGAILDRGQPDGDPATAPPRPSGTTVRGVPEM